ncbi:MAG: cytochrome B5 [candidate division Zixibacteria bacterium]|nr:cytochrome B5 [candidate division Zixibacteria bacterium]
MIFTRDDLRKYNGQNDRPHYIAYKGMVYDVSDSTFWEEGIHFDEHFAGTDISYLIEDAPHTEEVLEDYPIVGEYED